MEESSTATTSAAIMTKLLELEGKIEEVRATGARLHAYFKWTLIISVALIVLPLLVLPMFLSTMLSTIDVSTLQGLEGL